MKGKCSNCGEEFDLPTSYGASRHVRCPVYVICPSCGEKLRLIISDGLVESCEVVKK